MKTSRMPMRRQWFNIGKGAFKKGLPLEDVLTISESINEVIRAGYTTAQNEMKDKPTPEQIDAEWKKLNRWQQDGNLLYTLRHKTDVNDIPQYRNGMPLLENETTIRVDGPESKEIIAKILNALDPPWMASKKELDI